MNTSNIKKYAPKARNEFLNAVVKRLNTFGISADKKGNLQITEARTEGSVLQIGNYTFDAKLQSSRSRLVQRAENLGFAQLVEHVAYTWFNRLCAIRYMEIHDYLGHGFRVLSHPDSSQGDSATNKGRFEILDHAQDAAEELGLDRNLVIDLKLAGNKDEELYRELLLGQCHKLHEAMPFLFDALDDETELLLPDNLTRTDSILRGLVDGIPEEDWQQVEVIGWLYQFYISEKKDQVMGKVVKSEDIPAATQLFTPNWIVKYLVQNSVGRQWLQTYPDSAIKTQMEYYIEPAEQSDEVNQQLKAITPLSSNGEGIEPETIKVLDPACGSGHILIEAYNVLKAIYEERGFRSRDIPKMILENNLYGLDIDDRAAQLSGFALMMVARDDDKRIFTRNLRLNVLSLQESNHIDLPTLWKALNLSGSWQSGTSQGLFTEVESTDEGQDLSLFNADNRYQLLKRTLERFTQAKTFGSLIDVPSDEHDQLKELLSTLVELQESGDSMQKPAAKQLIEIVHQALVLSIRYDAVIANPPYMGKKGMNQDLKNFSKINFSDSKTDLFSIFIERGFQLLNQNGFNAQINMQSWMFLSSYEKLRERILTEKTIYSLAHFGPRAFSQISGEVVQTTAWIIRNTRVDKYRPKFYRLVDGNEDFKVATLLNRGNEYSISLQEDFMKIPGAPLAYWLDDSFIGKFSNFKSLGEVAKPRQGMATGNNDLFLRYWYEVDIRKIGLGFSSREDAKISRKKWFPYNKGGSYQKWYGNNDIIINWENDGYEIQSLKDEQLKSGKITANNSKCWNKEFYFRRNITWSALSTGNISLRYTEQGSIFDTKGQCVFADSDNELMSIMAILNSEFAYHILSVLAPTMDFNAGSVAKVPIQESVYHSDIPEMSRQLVDITKISESKFEEDMNFTKLPILEDVSGKISDSIDRCELLNTALVNKALFLECEINERVWSLYELPGKPRKISKEKITLKVNPEFCWPDKDSKVLLLERHILNLLSYAIGVMMGRFSLSTLGVFYANSSNSGFNSLIGDECIKFSADEDGVIPLTDQEWFKDDATNRFREFVQVVWGEEHLQENLDFVAESLCLNAIKPLSKKGQSESALETIRRYLSTQFYKDHLKTYKKRPIYWLFSSGKQKAFECLVYLHRYNEGTLSRMRTEYVTPLLGKYDAYAEQLEKQIEAADSTSEANRLKKELAALTKKQVELREFDDKLKHYADMRISLDLDDGVKVNYGKFGDLLADVKGVTGSAPEVK